MHTLSSLEIESPFHTGASMNSIGRPNGVMTASMRSTVGGVRLGGRRCIGLCVRSLIVCSSSTWI